VKERERRGGYCIRASANHSVSHNRPYLWVASPLPISCTRLVNL